MRIGRRRDRSRGQGVAEFALAIPIALLLLFAMFDLGRAIYAFNTIADAARTGVRVAIVDQDTTLIAQRAAAQAAGLGIQPGAVIIEFKTSVGCPADNSDPHCGQDCGPTDMVGKCDAVVTVPYDYTPATPVVNVLVGTRHLSSTSRLAVEKSPIGSP